jgi:hypothetical protein
MAADVCERAVNSRSCPNRVSEMMTTAASKYTATRPIETNESGNTPGATVATTLYTNAEPVPIPISVHMLGLRFAIDWAPRTKNGQPAHRTTGTDKTSSIQLCVAMSNHPS